MRTRVTSTQSQEIIIKKVGGGQGETLKETQGPRNRDRRAEAMGQREMAAEVKAHETRGPCGEGWVWGGVLGGVIGVDEVGAALVPEFSLCESHRVGQP